MNVALLLTPISLVDTIDLHASVTHALAAFADHGYTAVPLLDDGGRYAGTLTEGDLLRLLRSDPTVDRDRTRVAQVPLRTENRAVEATAKLVEILERAAEQNFVPVIDSRGVLMGIVTRRAVLEHLRKAAGL